MLTSVTGEETLTPNPNECNSTLTSETRGIYPHRYKLMLMSGVTGTAQERGHRLQIICGKRRIFLYSAMGELVCNGQL